MALPASEIDVGKIKLVWRGTYNGSTSYEVDDLVVHNDGSTTSSYINVANSTGETPSTTGTLNSTYWNKFAEGASASSSGTIDGEVQFRQGVGFAASSTNPLVYKDYTIRLGIGTTNPMTTLHVGNPVTPGIVSTTQLDFTGTHQVGQVFDSSNNFNQRLKTGGAGGISTFVGITTATAKFSPQNVISKANVIAGTANATSNIDVNTATTWLFTTASDGNWTHNIRGDGSTTLNSIMTVGQTICVAVIAACDGSHYAQGISIDGAAQTEEWIYNADPSTGPGASGFDYYAWFITKTSTSPSYLVLGSWDNYA